MSTATDASIDVVVNGDERTVPAGCPLPDLLREMEIDPEATSGVAVAINASVVRRQAWAETTLEDGDTVEVIQAQQGG
jgi:sulfur carrier protein